MHRSVTWIVLVVLLLSWVNPVHSYTLQYTDTSAAVQIKWPSNRITVALSTSLNSPPPNIKAGSDVLGAAQRALAHWSDFANIQFIGTTTTAQSISPSSGGDGITMISVADTPENRAVFSGSTDRTGRTRVFYDPGTGAISEADIVINPSAQFSTDGTTGTYDLESTLTHEIGHLLGLEHSGVVGATMQPRQGTNGLFGVSAMTPRTLSEDDIAGVRSIYGPRISVGTIAGTITYATGAPAYGAHVWVEEAATGRVIAGNVSLENGSYRIDNLTPGRYRLVVEYLNEPIVAAEIASARGAYAGLANPQAAFRVTEVPIQVNVIAGGTTQQNVTLNDGQPFLNARIFGVSGYLSTIAVPLVQGHTYTVLVGGEGMDQVFGNGIAVTSPFINVNQASRAQATGINYPYPIISFDISVSPNAPLGDYSIRLQSNSGEVAYISGGLTIDTVGGATQPASMVVLSTDSYVANEGTGRATITVNRIGNTASAATVDYATSDAAGLNSCSTFNGIASSRCDYATTSGTLRFAAGETSKTISIPLVDDGFAEGNESFYITLNNPIGATLGGLPTATVTITDNEAVTSPANPIDQTPFFVRQHYLDFLGREPEPAGYQGWQDILNNCAPGSTACDRIEVSSAFFRSTEFQERGYFIYRFYAASLGRFPHYAEFIPDLARVSGFLTPAEQEANKVSFINEFMARPEFRNRYDSLATATAYVDAILATAGVTVSNRAQLISDLENGVRTRAEVLRNIAESQEVYLKFYNQAFVVMQYFGYLRRDPDALYTTWIQTLNNTGDYRIMVNGFVNSVEYRQRFGP